ncbi:hypothetical protein [Chromohalobacter israelensis]|uniref:hypothetical protein n=1 Tax=Chromohalobacter israelensis TaxID=141390 RepID=UPI000FFECD3E|nr:hypothetical protein [Chromohalobacter salexigens]
MITTPMPQPTLFSAPAPERVLPLELGSSTHTAADLVMSLAMGRYHPLAIERDGDAVARGYIERTPTGLHIHLIELDGTPLIRLTAGTDQDAIFALGKRMRELTR